MPDKDARFLSCSAAYWCAEEDLERVRKFRDASLDIRLQPGEGLPGRAWALKCSVSIANLQDQSDGLHLRGPQAKEAGFTAALAVPVISEGKVLAVLCFFLSRSGDMDQRLYEWIQSASSQLAMFLHRKRAEDNSRWYQKRLRALAVGLGQAESTERRRVAKGLHDGVGQTLAVARIKLGSLKNGAPEELRKALESIASLIEQADDEIRTMTFQLSPPVLDELGLERAVEWLAERFQQEHGIRCVVRRDAEPGLFGAALRATLFQAVREILHNALKHAHAREIHIVLQHADGTFRVEVTDDGQGFDIAVLNPGSEEKGFGLFNIREGMESFGGRCEIISKRGEGTRVALIAPVMVDPSTSAPAESQRDQVDGGAP